MPKALRAVCVDVLVAARNVSRQGARTVAGALAVTFGTVALMLAAGFIEWIYVAMREGTIHSGLGHIQIVRPGYPERGASDPFSYLLSLDSPEKRVVEAAQHVISVAPRLKFTGLASLRDTSLSFLGQGLDAAREVGAEKALVLEAGEALADGARGEVLLGRGLADNLGAKVGDNIVLLVDRRGGTLGGIEVMVRGVFSTPTKAYDDFAVHVPFALADEVLQASGAHAWVVYLDETRNTPRVAEALRARLEPSLRVVPWYEVADFYNKTVALFSKQVLVMKIIIALVVIFSISNTMMRNVLERTAEIATSMALGLRRARVLARFLIEGLLLGLLGAALGLALGYLLAHLISRVGIPMPPPPGMARGYVGQIQFTPALAMDAVALAAATALIASLYPAWKAARLVIVDALRHGR